ncbi:hypothetical protein TNCV_1117441 [Trichonephila clavipes]|nr:hypothetical protein TNCV_1117441 [Trichonephila clavipes]
MSKRCGECEQTKFTLEKDSADFRIWCEGHQDICSATHVGSSGAMEAKVPNGHLVGSNQLLLDVRKNVKEAYGSRNDKDIVNIDCHTMVASLQEDIRQTSE